VEIWYCTLSDVFDHPDVSLVFDEYAAEAATHGLPARPVRSIYQQLENVGVLFALAALDGERLAGFMFVLVSLNPHYNIRLAVSESYFVRQCYRKAGAGLDLLHAAERLAQAQQAEGLLVSAPHGGRLEAVLGLHGAYQQSNSVFFRSFTSAAGAA